MQLCRYVKCQRINKSSFGAARMSVLDNSTRINNAVESFHVTLRRRVKVAHSNLYTFLGHLQRTTADGETDIARLNRGMSIRRSKKRINETRIKACISRFDSGEYTRVQFLCAVSHSVGAHAVPEDGSLPQIQTQRTTTKSATTATATSLSQLSVNRSRRTCARCVWCSSATHDLLSCRAGTSVSVLPASLSLSNKLAVAQSRTDISMVLRLY